MCFHQFTGTRFVSPSGYCSNRKPVSYGDTTFHVLMLNFHIVFCGGIPLDMSTNGRLWLPFLLFIQQTWEVFHFLFFDTGFYATSSLLCSLDWLWSDRPASVSHALEWQVCHHAFLVERRKREQTVTCSLSSGSVIVSACFVWEENPCLCQKNLVFKKEVEEKEGEWES